MYQTYMLGSMLLYFICCGFRVALSPQGQLRELFQEPNDNTFELLELGRQEFLMWPYHLSKQ